MRGVLLLTVTVVIASMIPLACVPSLESGLASFSKPDSAESSDAVAMNGVFRFAADKDGQALTLVPEGKLAGKVRIFSVELAESSQAATLRRASENGESIDELPMEWDGDEAIFGGINGYYLELTLTYHIQAETIPCQVTGNPASGMSSRCQVPKTLYCQYRGELEAERTLSKAARAELDEACGGAPLEGSGTKAQEEDDAESSKEGNDQAAQGEFDMRTLARTGA